MNDPCEHVNCGKYGRCKVWWNLEKKYRCECDVNHYGNRCQYRIDRNEPRDGMCISFDFNF